MSDWKITAQSAAPASIGAITLDGLSSVLAPALAIYSGQLDVATGGITDVKVTSVSAVKITAGTLVSAVLYTARVTAWQIAAGQLVLGGSGLNANLSLLDASNNQIGWAGSDAQTGTFTTAGGGVNATVGTSYVPGNGTPLTLTTTGTLPAGLSVSTTYYVVGASGSSIQFATSYPGTPVTLTTAGTGVHTFATAATNYGAWFKTCRVGGSSYSTAPLQTDSSGNLTITASGDGTTFGYSWSRCRIRIGAGGIIIDQPVDSLGSTQHNADASVWYMGTGTTTSDIVINACYAGLQMYDGRGHRFAWFNPNYAAGANSGLLTLNSCTVQVTGVTGLTVIDKTGNGYFPALTNNAGTYSINANGNSGFASVFTGQFLAGTTSSLINAGAFVIGQLYSIANVGTTVWTAIGAANHAVGTCFTATGVGSGTGTAYTATVTIDAAGMMMYGGAQVATQTWVAASAVTSALSGHGVSVSSATGAVTFASTDVCAVNALTTVSAGHSTLAVATGFSTITGISATVNGTPPGGSMGYSVIGGTVTFYYSDNTSAVYFSYIIKGY